MAFNLDKVVRPRIPHVLIPDTKEPHAVQQSSSGHYIQGFSVDAGPKSLTFVNAINRGYTWNRLMSLPRDHARALAYLLLLATSGPLERAAVIADAKAEGLDIGGITSTTP